MTNEEVRERIKKEVNKPTEEWARVTPCFNWKTTSPHSSSAMLLNPLDMQLSLHLYSSNSLFNSQHSSECV